MAAVAKNLLIEQKATFEKRLTYRDRFKRPINLTGCTGRLQIRNAEGTVLVDLSTESGVVLGGALGTIDLYLSDEDTALLNFTTGVVYDFKLTYPNGRSKRLFQGKVTLSPGVTE